MFTGAKSLGLAALLALSIGSFAQSANAQSISEEAKLYFKNGVELIEGSTPNYTDAYYQFKLAYEKSSSWKVLGNLGLCAMKLERDGEAIEHYTKYLAQGGTDIDPEERSALERDLLLLTGNAVDVTVSTSVPDIDVVDARGGSSAPAQSYHVNGKTTVIKLRAGTHAITAGTEGKSLRWEVVLSPGKPQSHTFDFTEKPPEPVATPATTGPGNQAEPAEPKKTGGLLRTVGFVTAGVGVVGLGAGIVTGLMSKSKESSARDKCRASSTQPGKTECPDSVEADFHSAESLASVTNVLLISGGVLTAAGVGMIIFGGPKTESTPTASLKLVPVIGTGTSGLLASGTF